MLVVGGGRMGVKSCSCQTQLSLNCVRLFWGCLGVVLWLSCSVDNMSSSLFVNIVETTNWL